MAEGEMWKCENASPGSPVTTKIAVSPNSYSYTHTFSTVNEKNRKEIHKKKNRSTSKTISGRKRKIYTNIHISIPILVAKIRMYSSLLLKNIHTYKRDPLFPPTHSPKNPQRKYKRVCGVWVKIWTEALVKQQENKTKYTYNIHR